MLYVIFLWIIFSGTSDPLFSAPFKKTFDSKNFRGIELSLKSGKLVVVSHATSNIEVEIKPLSSTETCEVQIREDVNELEISLDEKTTKDLKRPLCTDSLHLKIPEAMYLDVKSLSGDVDVKGKFLDLEFDSRSGSLLADVDTKSIEASTSSGSIQLRVSDETEVDLDSMAGNLDVEFRFNSTLDTKADVQRKDKDVKLRSQSGSITLKLSEKSYDKYKFKIESHRGQIKNDFEGRSSLDSKNSKENLKIKTGSGDIRVLNLDKK